MGIEAQVKAAVDRQSQDRVTQQVEDAIEEAEASVSESNIDAGGVESRTGGVVGGGRGRGGGGATAGAAAGGALSRMGGVGGAAKLLGTVAIGGVLAERMFSAMSNASGYLQASNSQFASALSLFFKPFGDAIGKGLLGESEGLLGMAKTFNEISSEQGLDVAISAVSEGALEGLGDKINSATGLDKLGADDLITGSVAASTVVAVGGALALSAGSVLAVTGALVLGAATVLGVSGALDLSASETLAMTGTLTLGAAGVLSVIGSISLSVPSVLSAAGVLSLSAPAVLAVVGVLTLSAAGVLAVKGRFTTDASTVLGIGGVLTVGAAAVLAIAGVLSLPAATVLAVTGVLTLAAAEVLEFVDDAHGDASPITEGTVSTDPVGADLSSGGTPTPNAPTGDPPDPAPLPGTGVEGGPSSAYLDATASDFEAFLNSRLSAVTPAAIESSPLFRLEGDNLQLTARGGEAFDEWLQENTDSGQSGGRVTSSGLAEIHEDEFIGDRERLVSELADAIGATAGGGSADRGVASPPTAPGRSTLDDVVQELRRTRESIEADDGGNTTMGDLLRELQKTREAVQADAPRPTQRNDPRYREARR